MDPSLSICHLARENPGGSLVSTRLTLQSWVLLSQPVSSSGNRETPLPTSLETQNIVVTKVRLTLKTSTPTSTLWPP